MPLRSKSLYPYAFRGAALAAAVFILTPYPYAERAEAQGAGPFAALNGSWSGGGQVAMNNGTNERIRCRVSYAVAGGGNSTQQDLRCASDSYKVDLSSNVRHSNGYISGNWSERTRNVGGTITGTVSGNHIQALVDGNGFSAMLNVTTRGSQQTISIQPRGSEVKEVTMTLRKG